MAGDDLFEILAEVLVESHGRVSLFGFAKDLSDGPAAAMLCAKDCHGLVVLLDDDLDTLPHFGEGGVKIAGKFGFGHVDGCHCFHYHSGWERESGWVAGGLTRIQ